MISRSEAEDLISKWASENVRLRIDFRSAETNLSVEGTLEVAAPGLIRVRLRDAGFIEVCIDSSWRFEYLDPNSARTPVRERIGRDHSGGLQETAAGVIGWCGQTYYLFLLEIVA